MTTGTILDEIVEDTYRRVAFERTVHPFPDVKEGCMVRPRRTGFPFTRALEADGMSFICEVKKASPSKGIITEDFPYLDIAMEYEDIGASAISVLTEPHFFKGSDKYLEEIADTVRTPILRKDFIIDEYQIYRAKEIGASAILLIAAILDDRQLSGYREIAESLGMSVLVETHDEREVQRAVSSGAGIIGVNNRDLRNFTVDIRNSLKLRELIPDDVITVSESGIRGKEDISRLRDAGFDAVLMGETFMRSTDKRATIEAMRS